MKTTDKAWLAGFIDGEGCIGIQRITRYERLYYNVRIQITQTNLAVLEHIQELTGRGIIHVAHRASGNQSAAWVWQVDMRDALPVLEEVQPYLRLKGPQTKLALEFADYWYSNRPRKKPRNQLAIPFDYSIFEPFKLRMHALNARGKEKGAPPPSSHAA